MPELPEVETVCRGLSPFMVGGVIERVDVRRPNLRIPFPKNMNNRLAGRKISAISRRAKYILVHIEKNKSFDDDILVIHLGMSGQIGVVDAISSFNPAKHDHMVLSLENNKGVVLNDARRFGMVMLERAADLPHHPAFCAIGPEPLADDFTGVVLHERLCGKTCSIKTALLDQHIVAGIGNIYASEALYQSGISPLRRGGDVGIKKCGDLVLAIRDVLTRAIAAGGSTLKDYKKADGTLGYFQHSFAVYDREGHPCPKGQDNGKKGHVIQKIVQSARATYYCAKCQK